MVVVQQYGDTTCTCLMGRQLSACRPSMIIVKNAFALHWNNVECWTSSSRLPTEASRAPWSSRATTVTLHISNHDILLMFLHYNKDNTNTDDDNNNSNNNNNQYNYNRDPYTQVLFFNASIAQVQ